MPFNAAMAKTLGAKLPPKMVPKYTAKRPSPSNRRHPKSSHCCTAQRSQTRHQLHLYCTACPVLTSTAVPRRPPTSSQLVDRRHPPERPPDHANGSTVCGRGANGPAGWAKPVTQYPSSPIVNSTLLALCVDCCSSREPSRGSAVSMGDGFPPASSSNAGAFIPANAFSGARAGYYFSAGAMGLGYYQDKPTGGTAAGGRRKLTVVTPRQAPAAPPAAAQLASPLAPPQGMSKAQYARERCHLHDLYTS